MTWMPIETAPHEATLLLYSPPVEGLYDGKFEVGFASSGHRWPHPSGGMSSNMSWHGSATHWMPLPPPPDDRTDETGVLDTCLNQTLPTPPPPALNSGDVEPDTDDAGFVAVPPKSVAQSTLYPQSALDAAVAAEREALTHALCRDCARGDKPVYHADVQHWYHLDGELGCTAAKVHDRARAQGGSGHG